MGQNEHHTTLSELGFVFKEEDLPIINEYTGKWIVTNSGHEAENYWAITADGVGHPVSGHLSPYEVLLWAEDQGWQVAYAAPYGKYVEGEYDKIHLHDWIIEGRKKRKAHHHS